MCCFPWRTISKCGPNTHLTSPTPSGGSQRNAFYNRANLIKHREVKRQKHAIEKIRRKTGSSKHVQKYEVIYKKDANDQIFVRMVLEEQKRDARLERKIKATKRAYKRFLTRLRPKVLEWKKSRLQLKS